MHCRWGQESPVICVTTRSCRVFAWRTRLYGYSMPGFGEVIPAGINPQNLVPPRSAGRVLTATLFQRNTIVSDGLPERYCTALSAKNPDVPSFTSSISDDSSFSRGDELPSQNNQADLMKISSCHVRTGCMKPITTPTRTSNGNVATTSIWLRLLPFTKECGCSRFIIQRTVCAFWLFSEIIRAITS